MIARTLGLTGGGWPVSESNDGTSGGRRSRLEWRVGRTSPIAYFRARLLGVIMPLRIASHAERVWRWDCRKK
jgi:hypothetical protein